MVGLPRSLFTEILSEEAQEYYATEVPHWTTIRRSHSPYDSTWTWLEKDATEKYVFCFYWTLGVMRTMPAEVTPVNLPERIFVLIFMFFALSAFAICVAQLTQAFFKFSERRRMFNEELAAVRFHLQKVRANDTIQHQVKNYLRHLFDSRRINAKEKTLISFLPEGHKKLLDKSQVLLHLQKLDNLPPLSRKYLERLANPGCGKSCGPDCDKKCSVIHMQDMFPGDTVTIAGRPALFAWIVISGRLRVKVDASDTEVLSKEVRRPKVIDQACLYTENEVLSERTVVVAQSAELMKIDKVKFLQLVKKNESHVAHLLRLGRTATSTMSESAPDFSSTGPSMEVPDSLGVDVTSRSRPERSRTMTVDSTAINPEGLIQGEMEAMQNSTVIAMAATNAVTG